MVKKGGSNLDSVIQPFTGETNGAQAAANDGQAAGEFHSALIQNAGSGIEVPTFSGNPEASNSSALINTTLINNASDSTGDIVGGKKRKSKSKKSKSKSKSKKNKSKSKKSKFKSKSKKNKSKSKKNKSKSKKRV
jgi:hypothetical protein